MVLQGNPFASKFSPLYPTNSDPSPLPCHSCAGSSQAASGPANPGEGDGLLRRVEAGERVTCHHCEYDRTAVDIRSRLKYLGKL